MTFKICPFQIAQIKSHSEVCFVKVSVALTMKIEMYLYTWKACNTPLPFTALATAKLMPQKKLFVKMSKYFKNQTQINLEKYSEFLNCKYYHWKCVTNTLKENLTIIKFVMPLPLWWELIDLKNYSFNFLTDFNHVCRWHADLGDKINPNVTAGVFHYTSDQ